MNFLSHDVILPDGAPPLMRVGSALPDLWGRLPTRPLPFQLLPALRAQGTAEARAIADGVESHLLADDAFHAHPEFLRRLDDLEPELEALWPTLTHAELAVHMLVEMILDRLLMLREPARLDRYYACFTADAIALAARHVGPDEAAREALHGVLSFFASSRFLDDYRSPAGLADRFARAWARTKFGRACEAPREALAAWVERREAALVPGSDSLIDAARQAILPLGPTP